MYVGGPGGKADLPGAAGQKRPAIRSRCVALSPAGREWAAATTEGLLLYSLDEDLVFDPTDLGEDVTPQAVHQAVRQKLYLKALLTAFRLQNTGLMQHALLSTPASEVGVLILPLLHP